MPKIRYLKEKVSEKNAVAFCHNHNHMGNLSPKLVKQHKCLSKQCPYFEKLLNRPFWHERAVRNCIKRAKRKGSSYITINGMRFRVEDANIAELRQVCVQEYSHTGSCPVMEVCPPEDRASQKPKPGTGYFPDYPDILFPFGDEEEDIEKLLPFS